MREKRISHNIIDLSQSWGRLESQWWLDKDKLPFEVSVNSFSCNETKLFEYVKSFGFEEVSGACKFDTKFDHKGKYYTNSNTNNHIKNKIYLGFTLRNKLNNGNASVEDFTIYYENEPSVLKSIEDFLLGLNDLKIVKVQKCFVNLVIATKFGLDLQEFDLDIPDIDIELNYGKDWAAKNDELIDILKSNSKKGIALLHGLPGTGKSMYIRYLISKINEEGKEVIYLPNQMLNNITDPAFIPLMAQHSGAIIIIEDGDEAIKARDNGGHIVDKLLNLADGILSDFLSMRIICTFNTDLKNIDDALLRKGRLILKHEFTKLSIEDAQKLTNKLGFKNIITNPMTLAEIYNQENKLSDFENKQKRNTIGFKND